MIAWIVGCHPVDDPLDNVGLDDVSPRTIMGGLWVLFVETQAIWIEPYEPMQSGQGGNRIFFEGGLSCSLE